MICSVCRGLADDLLYDLAPNELEAALISRLKAFWKPSEGICSRCVDAVRTSAKRLREQQTRPPCANGFKGYARYYLNRRESQQWHHDDPKVSLWRKSQTLRRVELHARHDGHNAWALFDIDEKLLAQGADLDRVED